ncbi:MAG: cupin domain-containing protein [Acetobacteraceae bacterium]|nr:cupin domain-containing protein [Acetobacteraceae bacterium]
MKLAWFVLAAVLAIVRGEPAIAQELGVIPDEIKWAATKNLGDAVVLEGDPAKPGPYVLRIKVPPNNVTNPHTHRQIENITVISGWIGFGLGAIFDKSKGRELPAGSFFHLPANTPHFAWTGPEGAVIQAHGVGPFP